MWRGFNVSDSSNPIRSLDDTFEAEMKTSIISLSSPSEILSNREDFVFLKQIECGTSL